jgi:hypothetical protein
MTWSSKSYFDYSFLLYHISYGYEYTHWKLHLIKKLTVSNLHDKMKKLVDNLLVKDDKV